MQLIIPPSAGINLERINGNREMIKKYILTSSFILLTSGCVASTATDNSGSSMTGKPNPPPTDERCLVAQPKDVHLWINAMPMPGMGNRPPLRATFTVTAPTPGYQFALKVNRVMESDPEQVILDLLVTRPSGMVAQVVTDTKVNVKLDKFPGSEGSPVQVNCGGKAFFKVDSVMAVH